MRGATALAALGAAVAGCPDQTAPRPKGDERLLEVLKAERERETRDGPTRGTGAIEPLPRDEQVNPLAEFAAKGTQVRPLTLPAQTQLALGPARLRLTALEASHTVGEGVKVTTADLFLKVAFDAAGPKGAEVDLTRAHLERGGESYAFARDAQVASKRPARVSLGGDNAAVTAWFEVPQEALARGLTLVVPFGEGLATLELQ